MLTDNNGTVTEMLHDKDTGIFMTPNANGQWDAVLDQDKEDKIWELLNKK